MKDKTKDNVGHIENEENGKADESPLVALGDVYTSREEINLYIINRSKTKLKNIITNEIKQLADEVRLFDVLSGAVESNINENAINDLRQYFKITKQIGFNPSTPYDFQISGSRNKLWNLSLFVKIQKATKNSLDYIEF